MIKRIVLILAVVGILSQFVQPDRSVPAFDPANDMLSVTSAPADIQQLVIGACYDCHSYKTAYPWYSKITPVNFIMQDHINEGREDLNFSVWDKYVNGKETGECGETIEEGEMPPGYYTLMHSHGNLTAPQKQQLIAWFAVNVPGRKGGEGKHEDHSH